MDNYADYVHSTQFHYMNATIKMNHFSQETETAQKCCILFMSSSILVYKNGEKMPENP